MQRITCAQQLNCNAYIYAYMCVSACMCMTIVPSYEIYNTHVNTCVIALHTKGRYEYHTHVIIKSNNNVCVVYDISVEVCVHMQLDIIRPYTVNN